MGQSVENKKIKTDTLLKVIEEIEDKLTKEDLKNFFNISGKYEDIEKYWNYYFYDKEIDRALYGDTDSSFFWLEDKYNDNEFVKGLEEYIAKEMDLFAELHNNKIKEKENGKPLLFYHFKNEMLIKYMLLYAKKQYIAIVHTPKGLKATIAGMEGRKAAPEFVVEIVNDLISNFLKEENISFTREDLVNKLKFYKNKIREFVIDKSFNETVNFLGSPVNISKKVENLDSISSYYRGVINFDVITRDILGSEYWKNNVGKAKHLYIRVKDLKILTDIKNSYSKYKQLKKAAMKEDIKDLVKDLTIPMELINNQEIMDYLKDKVEILFPKYDEIINQKFARFYVIFDKAFALSLIKNTNPMIFTWGKKRSRNNLNPIIIKLETSISDDDINSILEAEENS